MPMYAVSQLIVTCFLSKISDLCSHISLCVCQIHILLLADETTITATTTSDQKVTDIIPSPMVPTTIPSTGEIATTSLGITRFMVFCKENWQLCVIST